MNEKITKLETLREEIDESTNNIDDYASLDATLRKIALAIKHYFGETSPYLDDLKAIKFPEDPGLKHNANEDEREYFWLVAVDKVKNLLDIMIEDLKISDAKTNEVVISQKQLHKSNRIFVVHGKDEAMKQSVARTLEQLGLEPIILHEQPNKARTIIQKFEEYSDVGFAIVLLSPDDFGYCKSEGSGKKQSRARQNVLFEMGYFIGRLGRENVLPLYKECADFDMLSDYDGVLYTLFDVRGSWKLDLVKELNAYGYNVDANKLIAKKK